MRALAELPITRPAANKSNREHDCGIFHVLSTPRLHPACAAVFAGSFAFGECVVPHCARQGGSSDASVWCLARGIRRRKRESGFALTSGCEIGEKAVLTAK